MTRWVTQARQQGMVLITSLIILLVLTLLGLAAMQNTSLEERMAGNLRAENVAFQAAEAALRDGEFWLMYTDAAGTADRVVRPNAQTSAPDYDLGQVWAVGAPNPDASRAETWWVEADPGWWTTDGEPYQGSLPYVGTLPLADQPRHVIEEIALVLDSRVLGQQQDFAGRYFYQVTSRGTDPGGRGEVLLRSTFARRF